MSLIINNPGAGDDMKLKFLMDYPNMIKGLYERIMSRAFPVKTMEDSDSFKQITLAPPDGPQITIKQDDLALPYVTVMVHGDGVREEFSLSRAFVERVLKNTSASDEKKVEVLRSYPYRLPEKARSSFENLTREELYELVEQEIPEVRQLEFVQIRRILNNQKQQG
jgi:hypothetical protein